MMTMSTQSLRRMMSLAGALALMAGTSFASAQDKAEKPLKGSFDQPLQNDKEQEAGGDSNSSMMMSEADGQHTYTVKIENGKVVSAEIDGKKVPKSRVSNKNGKVEIRDEDGNVVKTFNVQVAGAGHGLHIQGVPGGMLQVQPWGQGDAGALPMAGAQPPVMIGITMSDDAEGEGVVVDSVLDGLPADKAGVKVGDHILSIDGQKVESQQALREVLKDKKPGETVELKIDRDGKKETVKVKLAKFEANRLMAQGGTMPGTWYTIRGDHDEALESAKAALQKALDEIKANENLNGDKIRAKAEEALKAAMESLEKAKDEMSSKMDELHGQIDSGNWKHLFGDQGGQFVMPQPPQPPQPMTPAASPDMSKQLEKLSQQIEKLNKRLEQLEKDKK
jgi:hypothetical protein